MKCLRDGLIVEVVDKDPVEVGKELAAKYGLVIASDVWIQVGNRNSATLSSCCISIISGESRQWNDEVNARILLESDLETELPEVVVRCT